VEVMKFSTDLDRSKTRVEGAAALFENRLKDEFRLKKERKADAMKRQPISKG
jgi:hypothetical protein